MSITPKLPRGVRNNNPGNLRSACAPSSKTHLNDGYAAFDTAEEGLLNLAWCIWNFYEVHRLNTIAAFISRYAPAGENFPFDYERFLATWLGFAQAEIQFRDLELFNVNRACLFMGGIIRFENGVPPKTWQQQPEWYTASQVLAAITATGCWA